MCFTQNILISQHPMLSVLYKSHFATKVTRDQETKSHAPFHWLEVT